MLKMKQIATCLMLPLVFIVAYSMMFWWWVTRQENPYKDMHDDMRNVGDTLP